MSCYQLSLLHLPVHLQLILVYYFYRTEILIKHLQLITKAQWIKKYIYTI